MQKTRLTNLFQTGWFSVDLPGYRPCRGTYELYPYDSLPPLPEEQLTGQLQWLIPLDPSIGEEAPDYSPEPGEQAAQESLWSEELQSIAASARHLGLVLPEAFTRLMSSATLQHFIPSCTGCYFNLSPLAFCPGDKEEGYVLRFLHDQQDCVIWHLYLSTRGEECVLASGTYLDQIYTNPEWSGHLAEEQVARQTWICAPSFEAFLYRFWIENTLWFNLQKRKPLPEEQKHYLSFYGEEKEEYRNRWR